MTIKRVAKKRMSPSEKPTKSVKKTKRMKSTAVSRLLGHTSRAIRLVQTAISRLEKWQGQATEEAQLNGALGSFRVGLQRLEDGQQSGEVLQKTGWAPPAPVTGATFKAGDLVQVGEKYRARYLEVYPEKLLNRLFVVKSLGRGGIVVNGGKVATAFLVAKSHLEKR